MMTYSNHTRRLAALGFALCLSAAPGAAQDAEPEAEAAADAAPIADAVLDANDAAGAETDAAPAGADAVEEAAADATTVEQAGAVMGAPATAIDDAGARTEVASADDATAADPEPEVSTPPSRPSNQFTFANSFFSYTNAVTLHTFAPGAQLSYDPTWFMTANITPRFYLTESTFLWLNQSASLELTDTNTGTYNREPLLADTLLDVRQLISWEGFVFQGQLRLGFPTSKASQAAGRILQTGAGLTVARPFPELAGFTVAATLAYRRWWATRNTPATGQPYPGNCFQVAPGAPPECQQASGQTSARDILLAGLTLNIAPFPGFTVSASGFYFAAYGHELAPAEVPINGGTNTVPDDSATHWRPFTYFSLAVAYDVMPWLNLQLGIQNSGVVAPLYNPDGSVRSPFTADTQVFLTTTVSLDGLYGEIAGGSDEDLSPEERQRRRQGLARNGGSSTF